MSETFSDVYNDIEALNLRLERFIIEKYEFYVNLGIVSRDSVDIDGWLNNALNNEEKLFLIWIANSVNFISKRHFTEMLRRNIEHTIHCLDEKPIIYTPVHGNKPKPTDSGNYVSRILRNEIGISEEDIKTHREAISLLSARNIIIYDDIVGTGSQFVNFISYKDYTQWGEEKSLLETAEKTGSTIHYCVPIVVDQGIDRIKSSLEDKVTIHSLYTITDQHSLSSSISIYWPAWLKKLIDITQVRDEILERTDLKSWSGFGDLAFTIVFDHGSPDFNMTLLKHKSDNWNPLITI
ncbi:hypothetical protein [Deinococcus aquaticus]|uniref:PRTase-CE domain-containing protein n=1 Tax=Deinococcus aquaticus TaxID=328692 RepID=A0ABY7V476_9DEIO|nr:hypothetical protein [Deinococcus aquaticus]WDA59997.1 hypothetical protein M8445_07315 [Deinococcus aquaticus]